jgi:lipoate-protein ligase A
MRFYDLGLLPWKQTQLIYHALGTLGENSVVLCTPKERYVCVGFHQNPEQELDLDYCKKNDIGIFRREIGGGTVLLDSNQIFFQMIIDREKAPMDQVVLFERFLQPIIRTYEELGIDARFIPICDLVVNGKKISGNGGGEIGKCKVATGSLLLDFDVETMSKVLKLPSEGFREKVLRSMEDNLTTLNKELGYVPDRDEIRSILFSKWKEVFTDLTRADLEPRILETMDELDEKFSSEEWLFNARHSKGPRNIKIIEGINLFHYDHQGLEIYIETHNEEIGNIEVTGQRSVELAPLLEEKLTGEKFDDSLIINTINTILSGVLDGNK